MEALSKNKPKKATEPSKITHTSIFGIQCIVSVYTHQYISWALDEIVNYVPFLNFCVCFFVFVGFPGANPLSNLHKSEVSVNAPQTHTHTYRLRPTKQTFTCIQGSHYTSSYAEVGCCPWQLPSLCRCLAICRSQTSCPPGLLSRTLMRGESARLTRPVPPLTGLKTARPPSETVPTA